MSLDTFFSGYTPRLLTIIIIFGIGLGILEWRLYYLQMRNSAEAIERVRRQSIRRIRIPAVRGRIISRDGSFFAQNRPRFSVYLHVHELRKPGLRKTIDHIQNIIQKAENLVGRPSLLHPALPVEYGDNTEQTNYLRTQIKKRIKRFSKRSPWRQSGENLCLVGDREQMINWLIRYKIYRHLYYYPMLPLKLFDDLQNDELARLEGVLPPLPAIEISVSYSREYPLRDVAAHIIGFVGRRPPPGPDAPEDEQKAYYFQPEIMGKAGLEKVFDSTLSGETGLRIIRVDSLGYFNKTEWEQKAVPGHDIVLTIDAEAQKQAQRLMEGHTGALVCMEVDTGNIIAIASSPSYDLATIRKNYGNYLHAPDRPLQNRALNAGTNPGSIVKPIVALAALHYGLITPDTTYYCCGYYRIGNTRIHCHHRSGHGDIALEHALAASCNPYFINLGMQLGPHRLVDYYHQAGIGVSPGLELNSRYFRGILPDPKRERPYRLRSELPFISIGQGKITLSPLQATLYTAAIANGGNIMVPHLVYAIRDASGRTVFVTKPEIARRLPTSPEDLEVVRQAMHSVVHSSFGTAKICRTPAIEIAGKTGTAERGPKGNRWNEAWFIAFAPYN
ncbi:MAG: hypothetical protein D6820_12990, partial [Lentisphaerae bacterium]